MMNLVQLRSSFTDDYGFTRWVLSIFVGGAVNSATLYYYRAIYHDVAQRFPIPRDAPPNPAVTEVQTQFFINIIPPTLIFFGLTIAIAFILTKITGERRIVPPLFLHIITFGWFIFAFVNPQTFSSDLLLELLMFGCYAYLGGMIQDKILVFLVGYSGVVDMNKNSLKVKSSLFELRKLFSDYRYLENLDLIKKPKEIGNGFRLQSKRSSDYVTIIDVKQTDSNNTDECTINVVVFDKGKYSVDKNDWTEEHLNKQMDIIRGILTRKLIPIEENLDKLNDLNQLETEITNQLNGISIHLEKLTSLSWIKIIAFLSILGFVGWLFYDKGMTEGVVGVIVMFLLYIVYETRGFRDRPQY